MESQSITIKIDQDKLQNFDQAIQYEWLETNGLGGWASSTVIGANTRRYHGLLVAATRPPVGRVVLLSKLDETIVIGNDRYELGCNLYPGAIHPQGFKFLSKFEKRYFPHFEYRIKNILIHKTVVAIHGENTTVILYRVVNSPKSFQLELQPLVAARDFHSLVQANPAINKNGHFENSIFQVHPYSQMPDLFISLPDARFNSRPEWYMNFEYPIEQKRGLDFQEDLFSYGSFQLEMTSGNEFGVIISTENPESKNAFELVAQEMKRRKRVIIRLPVKTELTVKLALAADQFVVTRNKNLRSLIAGYHWFADWGRDTMIALPGITLVTKRYSDAKKILLSFAQFVDQGMLPNRFPDECEEPEYNTVDATLWYFVAVYKYLHYTNDENFVRLSILPVLQEIIDRHVTGTRYNIHEENGLLYSGEPGVQLTWMDAKIGDWVVTPRQGFAVEINALWFNALQIMAEFYQRFNDQKKSDIYLKKANLVKSKFQRLFWSEDLGYLYDCIDGENKDNSLRPNQIFALCLPFPLLSKQKAKQVLKIIEEKLVTPFGLRTLSPDDPKYRPQYGGDSYSRDSAYHQGTVWSWLLGSYITALVRFSGKEGLQKGKQLIENMESHLQNSCIGSISEIFDAEFPFTPRGAVAQAWGIAEILRACLEDIYP